MTSRCPGQGAWRSWLDGELAAAEHARLRAHRAACEACRELLLELEPSCLFAALPAAEPPAELWRQLWPPVAAVVAREPRQPERRGTWDFRWPGWQMDWSRRWLAPAAAAAALLLLALGLPQREGRRPTLAMEAWQIEADTGFVAQDFVYLGNPGAQVAHLMLQDPVHGPVQLTMVLDEELEADLR